MTQAELEQAHDLRRRCSALLEGTDIRVATAAVQMLLADALTNLELPLALTLQGLEAATADVRHVLKERAAQDAAAPTTTASRQNH